MLAIEQIIIEQKFLKIISLRGSTEFTKIQKRKIPPTSNVELSAHVNQSGLAKEQCHTHIPSKDLGAPKENTLFLFLTRSG